MALISSMSKNGENIVSSSSVTISPETIIFIVLIILGSLLIFGLGWLIFKMVSLAEEKERYYKKLNENLERRYGK